VNGQRRKDLANEFGFPAISTTARIVFCFLHDLHHSGGFPDIIYLHPCQLPRSAGKELRGISRLLLLARGGVLDVVGGGGEGTRDQDQGDQNVRTSALHPPAGRSGCNVQEKDDLVPSVYHTPTFSLSLRSSTILNAHARLCRPAIPPRKTPASFSPFPFPLSPSPLKPYLPHPNLRPR